MTSRLAETFEIVISFKCLNLANQTLDISAKCQRVKVLGKGGTEALRLKLRGLQDLRNTHVKHPIREYTDNWVDTKNRTSNPSPRTSMQEPGLTRQTECT